MRVALQQTGWLKHPKVHVHASNGPASPKLTALVTKLGGELMPFAGVCGISGVGEHAATYGAKATRMRRENELAHVVGVPGDADLDPSSFLAEMAPSSVAGSAELTHILYPFGVRGDPDDGKCYMRSLERR